VSKLSPVSHKQLVTRLKEFGFEGPYPGGKHLMKNPAATIRASKTAGYLRYVRKMYFITFARSVMPEAYYALAVHIHDQGKYKAHSSQSSQKRNWCRPFKKNTETGRNIRQGLERSLSKQTGELLQPIPASTHIRIHASPLVRIYAYTH